MLLSYAGLLYVLKIVFFVANRFFTGMHEKLEYIIDYCFLKISEITMKLEYVYRVGKLH